MGTSKKLTRRQTLDLDTLASMAEEEIDTSDIPEDRGWPDATRTGEETDFDQRKRLQDETLQATKTRSPLTGFRGGDRRPRDEIHDRKRLR